MSKKQTDKVNSTVDNTEETKTNPQQEQPEQESEVINSAEQPEQPEQPEQETAEASSAELFKQLGVETTDNIELDQTEARSSITDAAVLGESIYFIRDNSTLFEKRKDGLLLELFVFPPTSYRVSIEGFYLNKLIFLIEGKLCTINDRRQLEIVVD